MSDMWRLLAVIWAVVSVGTVVWFVRLGRLRIKYAFPTMAPYSPMRARRRISSLDDTPPEATIFPVYT